EFFSEAVKNRPPKIVIEPHELIDIGSQGVSLKLIHNGSAGHALAMLLETYEPGSTTGDKIRHPGEETGTLLEGEITLTISGRRYQLHAGQSYVIDTGQPHSFSNTSNRVCRIVSAHSPANF
ncbi:MAG: cupin domain-containing protein, partial [Pantoea sp.]|nr:cupin domain-containing protein [Pantoea sp.]